MTSCWQFNQKERPSFGEIHSILSSFKMDSHLCDTGTRSPATTSDAASQTANFKETEDIKSVQE